MKNCSKCKQLKPLEEFAIAKTKADGRSYDCKECHKIYNKTYYKKNYDNERIRLQKRKDRQRDILRVYLAKIKLKCNRCEESRIAALDFHHVDPSKKEFSISFALTNGLNLERVKKEISKCEIICSNCHRVEHWGIM